MSEYMLQPSILPFPSFNEAKEKRRKVLDGVRERRKISYARYREKLRTDGENQMAAFVPLCNSTRE
jgi:hypothetical protein